MIENYWIVLLQILGLSITGLFAITFIGMPILTLMNKYQDNKMKLQNEHAFIIAKLVKDMNNEQYTVEDFLRETRKN